jgi:hypothetical protein
MVFLESVRYRLAMPVPKGFYPATEATAPGPDKIESLNADQLHRYYKDFAEVLEWLDDQQAITLCRDRMAQIERQLEIRRIEAHANQQHRENMALGRETLGVSKTASKWAKIGGIAGIVAAIAAVLAMLPDMRLSTFLRAMSSRPRQHRR